MAVTDIIALGVGHNSAGKQDLDGGIPFKKILHRRQGTGQILLVAVQISQNIPRGATIAPVHRVIHALILFDERFHARILPQPVLRPVIRTRILNQMLELNALLIGNRGDAQLKPF